jgi:predicted amidophosphoribosyltransferase
MARFGLRVVTLRANRRCPDCKTKIRRDARVCGSCGFRLRDEPSKKKQKK